MKKRIVGKQTGCTVKDGVYHIAPVYVQQFDALQEKRAAIDQLVAIVTDRCIEHKSEIIKANRALWAQLTEDLGLDPNKNWQYQNGVVTEKKEDAPETKEPGERG